MYESENGTKLRWGFHKGLFWSAAVEFYLHWGIENADIVAFLDDIALFAVVKHIKQDEKTVVGIVSNMKACINETGLKLAE